MSSFPTDPPKIYPPVGACIYCGSNDTLGDEHIIPFSLNGTHVLRQASCRKCEGITSKLDRELARGAFYQVRSAAGLRSRRKLPSEFPVILKFADGHEERVMVPAEIHPSTLVLPKFSFLPDLLSGRTPDGNYHLSTPRWIRESDAFDEFKKAKGAVAAEVEGEIKPQQFARALAKIAHGYAVAELGTKGFSPLLLDLIHGRDVIRGPELVGSEPTTPPPALGVVHELKVVAHPKYVVVRIRFFAASSVDQHAMPVYLVVAGLN